MRSILVFLLILFTYSVDCDSWALSIRVGEGSGKPPQFRHLAIEPIEIPVTIQLHNDSQTSSESVALWQLALSIVADSNSIGTVQISSLNSPSTPFLESLGPMIQPPTTLPSAQVIVSDFDAPPPPIFPGKEVLAGETIDLATIGISHSADSQGSFYLVLGGFGVQDGSVWSGLFPPERAFNNQPEPTLPDMIVLAEIVYVVPEPSTVAIVAFGVASLLMSKHGRPAPRPR